MKKKTLIIIICVVITILLALWVVYNFFSIGFFIFEPYADSGGFMGQSPRARYVDAME